MPAESKATEKNSRTKTGRKLESENWNELESEIWEQIKFEKKELTHCTLIFYSNIQMLFEIYI